MVDEATLTALADKCNLLSRLLWEGRDKQHIKTWQWIVSSTSNELITELLDAGIPTLSDD